MRLQQVLLVVALILIAATSEASERMNTKITTLPNSIAEDRSGAIQNRLLQTDNNADATDSEERAEGVFSNIPMHTKVRLWLERGKKNDYVKAKLKLNGLEGAALKAHKNYKYYEYFAKALEGYKVSKWLTSGKTTFQVWKELGFQHVTTMDGLKQIEKTDKFRIYERYVNDFDKFAMIKIKAGNPLPAELVSREATHAEIVARTAILAQCGRGEDYAKVALGLTEPSNRKKALTGLELKDFGR